MKFNNTYMYMNTHVKSSIFNKKKKQDKEQHRPLVKSAYQKKYFSYFSTKTYVVGTQKNRLDETFF